MPTLSITSKTGHSIRQYLRDRRDRRDRRSVLEPEDDSWSPQSSSRLCQLPRELLLQVISYAPGLHSINFDDPSNQGSAEGQLDDDTLEAQHGFLSLMGSCKSLRWVMQDFGSMKTLFVLSHTDFFSGLQASVEKSPSNTLSLLTLNHTEHIVAVLSPNFKEASLKYDELNAQPLSLFESRKSVKPKSFVSTAEPIFPGLRRVVLASGLRCNSAGGHQSKIDSRDTSIHLRSPQVVPHGLQIQLAQLATDNNAAYYQYKSRDHSEDAGPAWPQVSWAQPSDFFVWHLEPDCEHVARSVANTWSPGDFWVFKKGSDVTASFISRMINHVGFTYDGGYRSAEVYWPDPIDLPDEDKTAWLTTQQILLNNIISIRGGNNLSVIDGEPVVRMKFMSQAKLSDWSPLS